MKIFAINSVPYGSTARVMLGIAAEAEKKEIETIFYTGYSYHPFSELKNKNWKMGNMFDKLIHTYLAKITGKIGCFSRISTRKLLRKIKKEKPDILHLHNLHGWYINIPMLFKFIKKHSLKVVWTLHDCWTFTGHCPHFSFVKCEKWKTRCYSCSQHKLYPQSYVDKSSKMYQLKKEWFTGVSDLNLVTPSIWLKELVSQSFLKEYSVQVINNGIDTSIFMPNKNDIKKTYGILGCKLILGVSFGWNNKKGLDIFIELSKKLSDEYRIMLVGTDSSVDLCLPKNIIPVHRTQNQKELAEIYSAADVFFNPTREENYPTVNLETIACGTPVVAFDVGGCKETVFEGCGHIVADGDIDSAIKCIESVCSNGKLSIETIERVKPLLDMHKRFEEYVEKYFSKI